jgi:hypothetical protein
MSIQSIVKQIKEKSVIANDDLKDTTNSTRAMRQGSKKAAQEALVDLRNEYRSLLLSSATYVVLTGPQANELGEVAKEKHLSVNSEDFYRKLALRIDSRAYMGQLVASSLFNSVGNSLEETAREIGILSYPQLKFKSEYSQVIKSEEQFVEYVKNQVNDSVGTEMVGAYAVSVLMDKALDRPDQSSFTPILITAADENLAVTLAKDLNRLSHNVFVVSGGKSSKTIKNIPNSLSTKEVSPEALELVLEAIKTKTV